MWAVGPDGRVARKDQQAQPQAYAWQPANWNQWPMDQSQGWYGQPATNAQPMSQQPTNGFQVPQLGSIVGRKMVSIGSLDRPKITSGPKYFSADINDEQEFPEPSLTLTPKTDVREYRVVQTESFRKKKLSKVRRDKMRKIPLVEFLGDDCSPCECEHSGSGVPAPPEPEGKREKRAVVGDRRRKRTRFASRW